MKSLLLFSFLSLSTFINAQSWISTGSTWTFYWSGMFEGRYHRWHYEKDTVINGRILQKITDKTYESFLTQNGPTNFLEVVRDNIYTFTKGDSVFLWKENQLSFLYDFGAQVGDIWTVSGTPINSFCDTVSRVQVVGIGTINLNGVNRRKLDLVPIDNGSYVYDGMAVEGIGMLTGDHFGFYPKISYCGDTTIDCCGGGNYFRCFSSDLLGTVQLQEFDCDYGISVGMNELSNIQFSIYPNPTSSLLYIVTPFSNGNERIEVINQLGIKQEIVIQKNQTAIDVSNLPMGIYFIKYQNEIRRFIKE